jgi:hypothetical protein
MDMDNLRRRIVLALPLAVPLAIPHAASADAGAASPSASSGGSGASLAIRGLIKSPVDLSSEELRQSELVRDLGPITLRSCTGEVKRTLTGYRGLKLADLLDQAQLVTSGHNDLKRTCVVATAKDEYSVIFSWTELYNTPVGPSVFVLVEKNRTPLLDAEGPIALVSAADLRTGPRHVRWLASLEVRRV